MRAWRLYTRVLASHPRTTNICTAGIVSALADIAAQRIEYHHQQQAATAAPPVVIAASSTSGAALVATPTLASTIGVTATTTHENTSATTIIPSALLAISDIATSPNASSTSLIASDTDTNTNISISMTSIVTHDAIWLPDPNRLACMTLFGSLMGGVAFYHWYRWLDATFPGRTPIAVAKKVLLNLVTAAPANNSAFYGWILATDSKRAANHSKPLMCMDGITPATTFMDQWMSKLRADLPNTTLASFSFWGPIQMINFAFVPPQYRVLYQSGGVFTWTCWVNLVGHR